MYTQSSSNSISMSRGNNDSVDARFQTKVQVYLDIDDQLKALKAKKKALEHKQAVLKQSIFGYMESAQIYNKRQNIGVLKIGKERLQMKRKTTHKGINKTFLKECLLRSNQLVDPKQVDNIVEMIYSSRPISEKFELERKRA